MWARVAIGITIIAGVAQFLGWLETSQWIQRAFPMAGMALSPYGYLLPGVVNLAILVLIAIGLWKIRALERQLGNGLSGLARQLEQTESNLLQKVLSLEDRVWKELNSSLGSVSDRLRKAHEDLRGEVRAWIEQKQRSVDSALEKRVTLLERGEHKQRPPEPDLVPRDTLADGRTIVNYLERAFELGPGAYDYYRRLHKTDQRTIREAMVKGTRTQYDLDNFTNLTERYDLSDGTSWTRKQVDDLPYYQQAKLLDANPDLSDWWLGKPRI